MAVEIFVHKMSEHMETAEILEWRVKEGDQVEQYQVIMEVMTDKVTAELEAPAAGVIKGLRPGAINGATVPVGEPLGYIAASDEEVPVLPPLAGTKAASGTGPEHVPASSSGQVPSPAPTVPRVSAVEPGSATGDTAAPSGAAARGVRASPIARRAAKELGVNIDQVPGSGPGGRIGEDDVRAFAAAQVILSEAQPAPVPQPAAPSDTGPVRAVPAVRRLARESGIDINLVQGTGPDDRVTEDDVRTFAAAQALAPSAQAASVTPGQDSRLVQGDEWLDLTSVQRLTGQRMLESMQTTPQFALTITVDMTNALWLREAVSERIASETGASPSVTVLLVKAVAGALRDHPRANASLVQGRVLLHGHVNVGVAMGSDAGLVVPVIRDTDLKSLAEITRDMQAYQNKLATLRYSAEDLAGGTFTISNLGMYGIDHFTAIINPPQSAILAVGRIVKTPVGLPNDTIGLRPLMTMTLTVDHRVMDGLTGARFLAALQARLEKPYFML